MIMILYWVIFLYLSSSPHGFLCPSLSYYLYISFYMSLPDVFSPSFSLFPSLYPTTFVPQSPSSSLYHSPPILFLFLESLSYCPSISLPLSVFLSFSLFLFFALIPVFNISSSLSFIFPIFFSLYISFPLSLPDLSPNSSYVLPSSCDLTPFVPFSSLYLLLSLPPYPIFLTLFLLIIHTFAAILFFLAHISQIS